MSTNIKQQNNLYNSISIKSSLRAVYKRLA